MSVWVAYAARESDYPVAFYAIKHRQFCHLMSDSGNTANIAHKAAPDSIFDPSKTNNNSKKQNISKAVLQAKRFSCNPYKSTQQKIDLTSPPVGHNIASCIKPADEIRFIRLIKVSNKHYNIIHRWYYISCA